ncbi:MAG TPA: ATP-binding cassette domain-containing protein, partial [Burkholderiales bacterium]|nr:ATP-binding cassette domain-containing protein [Burkholderiales bacterium]
MASVTLSGVRKSFGSTEVLHGVDVAVEDGEFCVLVGPSGCGKSTLLRMIAGLEEISAGAISIGAKVVNAVAPKERDIAMVFQNYALYPHMSVFDNMAFSLKLAGESKEQTRQRVEEAALILGLQEYLKRYPRQLSGGQRQRVAMGRAIVRKPKVFLFDEPLSNLDAKLRVAMRTEIKALHQRLKKVPKPEIQQRVQDAARILGLTDLLDRKPKQLSGGQRQRVAMGRAIVRHPKVFLFDEPLSNLDAKLRVAMRSEIKELHQRLKTTSIYVTHDQIEAMTMADKIVVMRDGVVEQIGGPLELYD